MALTSNELGLGSDLILVSEESGPQPRHEIFTNDQCDPHIAQSLNQAHWLGGYVRSYQSEAGRQLQLEQSNPDSGELLYVVSALVLLQDSGEAANLVGAIRDEFESEERGRSSCGNTTFGETESFEASSVGESATGWTQSMSISGTDMTQTQVAFHRGSVVGLVLILRAGSQQPARDEAINLAQTLAGRIQLIAEGQE